MHILTLASGLFFFLFPFAFAPGPSTCETHQMTCDNGRCIDVGLICDGVDDCGDFSDERDCGMSHTGLVAAVSAQVTQNDPVTLSSTHTHVLI